MKKELLNEKKISIIIDRLCKELIENHDNFNNTVIVGVQPRGTLLSNRIIQKINSFSNISNIQNGNIDISFYRKKKNTNHSSSNGYEPFHRI